MSCCFVGILGVCFYFPDQEFSPIFTESNSFDCFVSLGFFKTFCFTNNYVGACWHVHVCHRVYWRLEVNMEDLVLSFHHDWIQLSSSGLAPRPFAHWAMVTGPPSWSVCLFWIRKVFHAHLSTSMYTFEELKILLFFFKLKFLVYLICIWVWRRNLISLLQSHFNTVG